MKKGVLIVGLLIGLLICPIISQAGSIFTLTDAQLLAMGGVAAYSDGAPMKYDVGFSALGYPNTPIAPFMSSQVDLTGSDYFGLSFFNDNDDIWKVQLVISDGTNLYYGDYAVLTGSHTGGNMGVDLLFDLDNLPPGFDLAHAYVGFQLTLISGYGSDISHMSVKGIPEPTTLLLFGSGLVATGVLMRKRRRN